MVQVRRALLVSSILSAGSTRRAPYSSTLHREAPADLDQVIGDHAESDPAFHAVESSVAATTQSMAALEHADAPLASGPPSLARAEPTLLLPSPPLLAARAPVGNRHSLHAHGLNRFLVPLRIKPRVGSRQVRCAPQPSPMFFYRGDQQRGIRWAFREHFVVRDDLVLGLLHLDQFAKLGWLTGFAFANDFRVRLEHAHDLAWKMRDSLEVPGLGLLYHLPHSLGHEFQCFPHLPHPRSEERRVGKQCRFRRAQQQ